MAAILAIGDALRTDLAPAQGLDVDALFIAGGIHKHDAMADGAIMRRASPSCSRRVPRPR